MYDDFMQVRVDAMEFMLNREKMVFERWATECNLGNLVIAYDIKPLDKCMLIYSDSPGILIGYKGKNVACLQKILKDVFEVDTEFKIEFKEIKGRFIQFDKNTVNFLGNIT